MDDWIPLFAVGQNNEENEKNGWGRSLYKCEVHRDHKQDSSISVYPEIMRINVFDCEKTHTHAASIGIYVQSF